MRILLLFSFATLLTAVALAENPTEDDFYQIVPLPIPAGVVLEAGGLEMLPAGQLAVSSRRGDIYTVSQPFADPGKMKFTRFASGLHEVLGLTAKDDWLYVTQRCDVSRLRTRTGTERPISSKSIPTAGKSAATTTSTRSDRNSTPMATSGSCCA